MRKVCFDTVRYSLKPAKFMEDMAYDMAGSAIYLSLMKNFALRKAKINELSETCRKHGEWKCSKTW